GALGAQRAAVGGVVGVALDVGDRGSDVLRLVPDGVDDHPARHGAVGADAAGLGGAKDLCGSELGARLAEIEESEAHCPAQRGGLEERPPLDVHVRLPSAARSGPHGPPLGPPTLVCKTRLVPGVTQCTQLPAARHGVALTAVRGAGDGALLSSPGSPRARPSRPPPGTPLDSRAPSGRQGSCSRPGPGWRPRASSFAPDPRLPGALPRRTRRRWARPGSPPARRGEPREFLPLAWR